MSLPWPGVKAEQVSVVVYSDELRQVVTDLPNHELAGSLRNVSRHYAVSVPTACTALVIEHGQCLTDSVSWYRGAVKPYLRSRDSEEQYGVNTVDRAQATRSVLETATAVSVEQGSQVVEAQVQAKEVVGHRQP